MYVRAFASKELFFLIFQFFFNLSRSDLSAAINKNLLSASPAPVSFHRNSNVPVNKTQHNGQIKKNDVSPLFWEN
jgi:hypothetical protein